MAHRIVPVIISGGAGTRLWPISSNQRPKQFHALGQPDTMFALALDRARSRLGDLHMAPPIVICAARHADLVATEAQRLGVTLGALVTEPSPRNTAAACAVAAIVAREIDDSALALIMPADQIIEDVPGFHEVVARAAPIAEEAIVTFGMKPMSPATGYGYIRRGAPLAAEIFAVSAFHEKPTPEKAEAYVASGDFYWNAGIFLSRPEILIEEFSRKGDIFEAALAALKSADRSVGQRIALGEAFLSAPSEQFDTAVMETTKRAAVAPCDIGWADLGAWDEVWRRSAKDESGNAVSGGAIVRDATNNLIFADGAKVCVLGVSGLVIAATSEGVVIAPRERAQELKTLIEIAHGKI